MACFARAVVLLLVATAANAADATTAKPAPADPQPTAAAPASTVAAASTAGVVTTAKPAPADPQPTVAAPASTVATATVAPATNQSAPTVGPANLSALLDSICVHNTLAVVSNLMEAGVELQSSISTCVAGEAQDDCLADVFGIIGSLGSVGEYLATAISSCNVTFFAEEYAECAGSVMEVVGALGFLGEAASQIPGGVCNSEDAAVPDSEAEQVMGYDMTSAQCAFSSVSAMNSILGAINEVTIASEACPQMGGASRVANLTCGSAVSRIFLSMANIGEFLVKAAGECSLGALDTKSEQCGAVITQITAGFTSVASAGTRMALYCTPEVTGTQERLFEVAPPRMDQMLQATGKTKESRWGTIFGMLLPVAGLVGFIGGQRHGRGTSPSSRRATVDDDCEQLIE